MRAWKDLVPVSNWSGYAQNLQAASEYKESPEDYTANSLAIDS